MANTYTWKVGQCDRVLETGVITTLHYMIAYDAVTEAQAVSWAQAALGGADKVAEIHAALDAQLTEKRTPTTGSGTPW